MTIPILLKRVGAPLPPLDPGQVRYVLARDGLYFERATELFATTTRAPGPLPELDEHHERCVLQCGRIPRSMTRLMLAFFRAAYYVHEGEAALVLLHHTERGHFRWYCPDQTVELYGSQGRLRAGDAISYENPVELPDGYTVFGDAHSHGTWAPIPSAADRRDEAYKDGLHIIVGDIMRRPQYHIDFVMDGQRFNFPPEVILDDAECEPFPWVPSSWLGRIHTKRVATWPYSSYRRGAESYDSRDNTNRNRNHPNSEDER